MLDNIGESITRKAGCIGPDVDELGRIEAEGAGDDRTNILLRMDIDPDAYALRIGKDAVPEARSSQAADVDVQAATSCRPGQKTSYARGTKGAQSAQLPAGRTGAGESEQRG